jgi:hypothetical protein
MGGSRVKCGFDSKAVQGWSTRFVDAVLLMIMTLVLKSKDESKLKYVEILSKTKVLSVVTR